MRIPRIYHPGSIVTEQQISLNADASNHLVNVLRLKPGHPIVLFNGDGNEYSGQLESANKRQALAWIDAKLSLEVESPLNVHLGQAVSKGERMEFALQKSVELGVIEITPLLSENSVVKLSDERWQKKQQQWQKIIIGACEQSGRNRIPKLHPPTPLNHWLQQSTQQLRLTLDPASDKRLQHLATPTQGVRLLIGPEGGLSDKEVYLSGEHGFERISLGPRILRTETAALAALAALQAQFGDL